MWRWLNVFRPKVGRTDDEVRPDVDLVRMLVRQISLPQKAAPVLEAVEAFVGMDRERRHVELPRIYLLLEQYLTDVDPVRTFTRAHLRELTENEFPELARDTPFCIIFEAPERQELLLSRDFLLDALGRAIHVLGGGTSLARARAWIRHAPEVPPRSDVFDVDPPETDAAWIEALTHLSGVLYQQLRVGLGEATAGIYDAAYAALAHQYAGLETFPVVVRLLPDGLLDEQRIQSLARHGTMSRVQGELSAAKRSALDNAIQLQAVLDTVGEGIVTVDAGGSIVLVNREIERTFRYPAQALIGAGLNRLLTSDSHRSPEAFFEHLGEAVSAEGRRCDGTTFPVEVCINETRISDQLFYTAAVRDVTVQRNYERELLRAKDHAEEMTRLKTAFLANMSHEIRTPLSGILGAVQILDDEIPEDQKEFTRMVNVSARRLLSTLDAVLEFARLESGAHECTCRRLALAPLLKTAHGRFDERAREKGLSFRVEAPAAEVSADPDGLNRILDVLLENAIRFTHRGSVLLAAHVEDGTVCIEVRDDGIGISPAFLPHIFDEFRQESTGHARTHEGTGLGLAIARRHAEAMDGRLRVESTLGSGSTFSLSLPSADRERSPSVRTRTTTSDR